MSKILIIKNGGASTIYFKNCDYHPNADDIQNFIKKAIYNNRCSSGSTRQISHGEVSLHFNPAVHESRDRRKLEKELKKLIESQN